jgi:DNA-binding protein HU-beta
VNKQEFIDVVASKGNMTKHEAAEAVDAVLESITDVLGQGGQINFTGFGKFSTQYRKERRGVNPRNPTRKVTIPATTVPKFSAGSSLKQAVKRGGGHSVSVDEITDSAAAGSALPGDADVDWEE